MPDNRKNQSNATSISSNGPFDNIEEGMWKMKSGSKEGDKEEEKEDRGQSKQYPDRPGEPDCGYYLRTGLCGYGSNCRFNHPPLLTKTAQNISELPQREGQSDCGYYLKTGTCKYGSTCKYHHALDRRGVEQVALNLLGLPMRQEEKPCPYYMRTYTCKFGPTCFIGPQTWNSYMGNLNPISTSGLMGTNVMYNTTKNQGELVDSGQLYLLAITISQLPERPDHPEC